VTEPVDGDCFQSDTREPVAGVHGGHPAWTRLELAKGAKLASGSPMFGTIARGERQGPRLRFGAGYAHVLWAFGIERLRPTKRIPLNLL